MSVRSRTTGVHHTPNSNEVVEANPRLVMAVMAIGMIVGALLL